MTMKTIDLKSGESVKIGEDVLLSVQNFFSANLIPHKGRVKIRIECPEEIKILRGELLTRGNKHA